MFSSKKFKIIFIIEMILPYLTLVCGIPAIYYYNNTDNYEMLEFWHSTAFIIGLIFMIIEYIGGVVAFIWMVVSLYQNTGIKYSVSRKLLAWVCSRACIVAIIISLLIIQMFTYAQSV